MSTPSWRRWEQFSGERALLFGTNQSFPEVAQIRALAGPDAVDTDCGQRQAPPTEELSEEEAIDE